MSGHASNPPADARDGLPRGRKIRLRFLAALALACAIAAVSLLVRDAQAGTARPVSIGVSAREFHLTAYRKTVAPGKVRFNVMNYGEDTHNLVVTGPGGFTRQTGDIGSGDQATLAIKLGRTGTYKLLCTKADHLERGMRTRLVVRRPRR